MKHFAALLSAVLTCTIASAQVSYDLYVKKYSAIAVAEMNRSGVPASITLAQGLLESAAGSSVLAREGNNHFGIKCAGSWTGAKMYYDDDRKGECFRKYSSAEDSFKDHSDFLRYSRRYQPLFDLEPTDYKGWAYALKSAGYATDPKYPAKLIKIIEDFSLYRYDSGAEVTISSSEHKRHARPSSGDVKRPTSPTILQQASRSTFKFSASRPVYEYNGVPFIYVVEGETLESIALCYNLFPRELAKFNDLGADTHLEPGDRLYLARKKSKAVKGLEKHVVESEDETITSIAQHYAIRYKSLLRLNGLKEGRTLREGDILNLR